MEKFYWTKWKNGLDLLGIKPLACALFDHASSLFPIFSQVMLIGLPLFQGVPSKTQYQAIITLFRDEENIAQFSDFLQGV